jgi:RND family efflux transporter MFP subunit
MKPVAAAVLVVALAACKPPEQPKASGAHLRKPRVTAAVAAARELESAVEAPGTLEAAEEISIPARVAGLLDAVRFKEGDAVDESTVLAEIELDRHRLYEERAQADFDRARAAAVLAETVYKNRLVLYEEGRRQKKDWVTEEQMATWKADADRARAEQERYRVELDLSRRNHRDARVRAPLKGLINRKLASKGEYVKPETVLATMLNLSTLHLRFTVTELEAARLAPGLDCAFTLRSAPGRTFTAKLFHLSQKADSVTRSVECKAEVASRDEAFRAGLFAQVRVSTGRRKGVVVPERAVVPSDRGFTVFVIDEARKASGRSVRLGLRVPGGVEIAEGLEAGARIAVDGAPALRDGLQVEIAGDSAP